MHDKARRNRNRGHSSATGILPYGIGYADPALANTSVHYDLGYYGPQIELVHAYYNYWPTVRVILHSPPEGTNGCLRWYW